MNQLTHTSVTTLVVLLLFSLSVSAQNFGSNSSAVWISDCNQSGYWNTNGAIGANGFSNADLGSHNQNSGSLVLRGAEVRSFKTPGVANVCAARLYYRIYPAAGVPGSFSAMDLNLADNCNTSTSQFPSGGACADGDQKWNRVIADGVTTPYAPVNLTMYAPGNYVLEVYYELTGSSASTTLCDNTVLDNNGGNNYKATFSINAPALLSTNPTTCNGSEGTVNISGLTPGAVYSVSYSDDGNPIAAANYTANASGQVIITGLNAGIYSEFTLVINGCTTQMNTGIILSNPVFTPTFNSFPPICQGSTPPSLPTTSNNGLTGTWNPSVINNMASGSYTFTPTPGQCGIPIVRNITIIQPTVPTFSFGTALTICAGGSVPALPSTSTNGITGSWSPATVDNNASGVYTFTPTAGLCAAPASFSVTVNNNITPTFSFGTSLTICAGEPVAALPTTSTNGIDGTWSPAVVDNTASGTYTFTPAAGECAVPTTFTVTVNPIVTPVFSFGTSLSICNGATAPVLPTTSDNGEDGSWSPAAISNTASGSYTFTPTNPCATPVTLSVTVDPIITPVFSFGTSMTICAGGTVPTLTNTSTNGITGTWSPATVDNQASGSYTFTPDAGLCAAPVTFSLTVNPNITPTFSFGTAITVCTGATVPALPTTSANGINGTWSPAAIDNQASGTYTFTPAAGVCALPTTLTVTVNPIQNPVFSFGTSITICAGASVPALPSTSDNGLAGSWSPSSINNNTSGNYTFTPADPCATPVQLSVTVNPMITPVFSFGTSVSMCEGATAIVLPSSSTNGINGTWSPATVDNMASGTYTFTPTAGQCAPVVTLSVTVNANVTPAFSFGTAMTICASGSVPTLATTSTNGITGVWSPATVNNQASGTYTFTPAAGQCATTTTFTLTVNNIQTPVFSFGSSLTICAGGTVPALPSTSDNGLDGSWSPATVSNTASGVYTFTPTATCGATFTFTVTVNPILQPTFDFGTAINLCSGSTAPILPNISNNGISGVWSPAVINNQVSGTYTFTSNANQCAEPTASVTVTVNPVPTGGDGADTTVFDGDVVPANVLNGSPAGVSFSWKNNNPSIGLAATGTGNIPSFTAINSTDDDVIASITVTPMLNGCAGAAINYEITVKPLNKDVFVPNVFTPNADGKNDLLMVYGNYITKVDMRIFNQWGEEVNRITDKTKGWDGRHKGKAQPVGVYVYVLQAELTDGRTVKLKGSITLIR